MKTEYRLHSEIKQTELDRRIVALAEKLCDSIADENADMDIGLSALMTTLCWALSHAESRTTRRRVTKQFASDLPAAVEFFVRTKPT